MSYFQGPCPLLDTRSCVCPWRPGTEVQAHNETSLVLSKIFRHAEKQVKNGKYGNMVKRKVIPVLN